MIRQDLQTLRIFLAACELRSISKAAESLNIAVSAASRRLSLLEQEAKVPLVVRRSHGIEPTAGGITMMNYARNVLRLGEKVRVSLDEHRLGVRGYVRVSASSSALVQHLAKDLSAFAQANPEIKLDLQERPTNATIEAVLNKQSDIGIIVRGPNTDAGLEVTDYEAFTISNRIAVMERGQIAQVGTPSEIYRSPSNHFVADFVGDLNCFEGVVQAGAGGAVLRTDAGVEIKLSGTTAVSGATVTCGIRPEKVRLDPSGDENIFPAVVRSVSFKGNHHRAEIALAGGDNLVADLPENSSIREGENVRIGWRGEDMHIFAV